MVGFEPRISSVESDHSDKCAEISKQLKGPEVTVAFGKALEHFKLLMSQSGCGLKSHQQMPIILWQ